MARAGKRYKSILETVDREKIYDIEKAFEIARASAKAKFDESIDIAVNLGVDPKHADQMIRGTVVLPNGIGKKVRVLAIAKGEKEREAKEAGADFISFTVLPISKLIVPVFGFGINPLGPRILPSFPTELIISGVATTLSKSSHPS